MLYEGPTGKFQSALCLFPLPPNKYHNMKNVSVIGAGTMGNGIAHVFAMHGFNVNLVDVSSEALERGMATIGKNLDRMVRKEKITEEAKKNTLEHITTFTDLQRGVAQADLVVEAATENTDLILTTFT